MMATVYATSFEAGLLTFYEQNGWSTNGMTIHSGTRVHKTLSGVGGNYAMNVDGGSNLGRSPNLGTNGRWVHFYSTPQDPGTPLLNVFNFEITAASQFTVRILANGIIELLRGATTVATSATAINRGVGHWFALQLLAANAGGVCEVWVDGVLIVSFTGDTQNQATANWDTFRFTDPTTVSDYTFDDFIVTDATTGRIAEQVCQVMVPDSVVSGNLTGNPITGANRYQNIDEIPTSQTDYNSAVAANDEDLYGLSNPANAPSSVHCVAFWAEAARSGSLTSAEISVKSGATTVYSPVEVLPASGFESIVYIRDTDPDTAAAWTAGGLNGAQAGIRFT